MSAGDISVITMDGLEGHSRLVRQEGLTVVCLRQPYGIADSLKSDSIVTISGSGQATDQVLVILLFDCSGQLCGIQKTLW